LQQQSTQQHYCGTPKSGSKHGVESIMGVLHHISLAWVKLKNYCPQSYSSLPKKIKQPGIFFVASIRNTQMSFLYIL
jgi:hypothetical protein